MIWGRKKQVPDWAQALPAANSIEDLASKAGCIATQRITKDGARVGYMIRSGDRSAPEDTGWQFFAGDEDEAFLDDSSNSHVFSVNTIANHDRAIIPFLNAPDNTAWIRDGDTFIADPEGVPERD
jgi:hypothetical protein